MSVEKSQAQFSFPQANRWDGCKIFVNELTKNENIGKNAPGPQYMYNDNIKYADVSYTFWKKMKLFWGSQQGPDNNTFSDSETNKINQIGIFFWEILI